MDICFLFICPVIDDKFRHNIVKVCRGNHLPAARDFYPQFDNVMTQFIINEDRKKLASICKNNNNKQKKKNKLHDNCEKKSQIVSRAILQLN